MNTSRNKSDPFADHVSDISIPWKLAGWVLFFTWIVILIQGCQSSDQEQHLEKTIIPEHVDTSLLTGEPCLPPCWYGLVPGESSKEEADAVFASLSFVESDNVRTNQLNWSADTISYLYIFDYVYPEDRLCCSFEIAQDELKTIRIRPNYEIRFRDVVRIYGNPDYVSMDEEHGDCFLALTWIDYQLMILQFRDKKACKLFKKDSLIDPDLLIDKVYYETRERVVDNPPFIQYPWKGFRDD